MKKTKKPTTTHLKVKSYSVLISPNVAAAIMESLMVREQVHRMTRNFEWVKEGVIEDAVIDAEEMTTAAIMAIKHCMDEGKPLFITHT